MPKTEFAPAMVTLLEREGFYSNRKNDRGGETCCGIARKSNPDWPGWALVDESKSYGAPIDRDKAKLQRLAGDFYYERYWAAANCYSCPTQELAELVFDTAVNHGVAFALTTLAMATADHDENAELIFHRIMVRRLARFAHTVSKHPEQIENLRGWCNRLLSFYKGPIVGEK